VVLLTWYPTVSFLLGRAGRPRWSVFLHRVQGSALVALGTRLATAPI
jgi:hypothetical protein